MLKILITLFGLLVGMMVGHAAFISFGINAPAPVAFVGFLDTYPTGATWGWSTYKLTAAYGGNWGTVQRQSDSTTQVIGFLSTGKADVATFNSFCSGTYCYVTTLVDQVNGINASQATFANMPRVIVDANNVLAVCPQPASRMTTSFNAAVNTAKVHAFVVAKAGFADYKYSQAGVPTISVTANVTSGSPTITSMSSQVGISTATGGNNPPTAPGVVDSSNLLPNSPTIGTIGTTLLSALPTGTTGTLGFSPGNLSPTGSQTGDTLTFTNSIQVGAWLVNGPASSTYYNSAYWAIGIGDAANGYPSDWISPRNASDIYLQFIIGQGMRAQWGVYDYDTFTANINYNGVNLGATIGSTANITYSTNVGMTLFADTNGNEQTSQACFETMVLYNATQTSRIPQAQALMAQSAISFPFVANTSDGFAMTGNYQPGFPASGATTVYGAYSVGPDAWGMSWNIQSGGYVWSAAYANNINNSTTMWRFTVQQGDSDVNISGAERSEINNTGNNATPGNSFSSFYQFDFEQYQNQTGDWCDIGQVHYNNVTAGAGAPDIISVECRNNQLQFLTQKTVAGNTTTTNCGSPIALTQGTTYAVIITGFWSTNTTSDTLTINAGPNSVTPIPQICSVGPTGLWNTDTGAYMKAGIYRGFPWSNPGTLIHRVMNMRFAPTTANAYSSYITTPPALPTH